MGRRRWMLPTAAVIVAVVGFALALQVLFGTHRGTVHGDLVFAGGPSPGALRALPGVVTFRNRNGDIQTVTTRDGSFSIDLPEGHYQVRGRSPLFENDAKACGSRAQVTVRASRTSVISVRCEGF